MMVQTRILLSPKNPPEEAVVAEAGVEVHPQTQVLTQVPLNLSKVRVVARNRLAKKMRQLQLKRTSVERLSTTLVRAARISLKATDPS